MTDPSALSSQARRVLDLARRDRSAAGEALGGLPLDAQVALVCETPVARRAEILALAPEPERIIPALPEAELCFTVKAVGLADADWILEHATRDQIVASVDLDAWQGDLPDRSRLDGWIDALARTRDDSLVRSLDALDGELLVLHLKSRVDVFLKPNDDEDWQPPQGAQTLDGQFYLLARKEGDDLASDLRWLQLLFQRDYWSYFRFLQGVIWELESETEEWALRWRSGRLEDLGFPPWEEAMSVYRYLSPQARELVPDAALELEVRDWRLPVWLPDLPAGVEAQHLLFRTLALLDDDERRAHFFSFVALANKVAVADGMPLSDAESTPAAIEKAGRIASDGLAFLSERTELAPSEVLRRVTVERLFRVGANLDPEGARR